jgi:putative oxidoreductase
MKHLKSFENSPLKNADGLFALFRLILGVILMWKCVEFYLNREAFLNVIAQTGLGWLPPVAWAHFVILAHFFGGLCLLAGIATRFACILQLPILAGAVFWVHLPEILQVFEFISLAQYNLAVLTLVLLTFYSIRGAGVYSLDYYTALDEEGHDVHNHPHGAH